MSEFEFDKGAAPEAPEPAAQEAAVEVPVQGEHEGVKGRIVEHLKTVFDPEIPVNIYELGLIYRIDVDDAGRAEIDMTLTAPGCPVAGQMPAWVEDAAARAEGVTDVAVDIVWEPTWNPDMMSEAARLELGMM